MLRALAVLVALLAAAPSARADEGAGTEVGGDVTSTLSLGLAQTGSTVRAVITTTEPGTRLSVASDNRFAGLRATLSRTFAPLDAQLGLTLASWDDVLAGEPATIRLQAAPTTAPTVFVTLSTTTP